MRRWITLFFVFFSTFHYSSGQMLPVPDQKLIKTSVLIVRCKIISEEIQWTEDPRMIFTFIKAEVSEKYKGHIKNGSVLTIAVPGGFDAKKDIGMGVSDQAKFTVGEEAILFLTPAEGYSDGIDYRGLKPIEKTRGPLYRVNGFFQGKQKIYHDKQLNLLMVNKPNEGKSVEANFHFQHLKRLIKENQ